MKNKVTKILIAGAVVVIAISAVVIVKNRVSVNRDGTAVSIIGGADGPTSVFIAGKLSKGDDVMEYTSITMEEAKKVFAATGDYIILDCCSNKRSV